MHNFINYICVLYVVLTLFSAIAIRKALVYKVFKVLFFLISAGCLFYFVWVWNEKIDGVWNNHKQYSFGIFLSWLLFMLVISVVLLLEDITRFLRLPFRFKKEGKKMPRRQKWVSIIALSLGGLLFLGMLYGMLYGKYDYRVVKHTLYFDNLPEAFDGYKISQISDIHAGSFDDAEKVSQGVALVNAQQSDLVVFTGDLVNNRAVEMQPWIAVFQKLTAKDGVYSVLGNHDYGDYVQWKSVADKEKNLENLKNIHKQMGFNLLLNESVSIKRQGEKISLMGVENWGKGFIQKGDLKKALENVPEKEFKILLSHDPSHWQYEVVNNLIPIELTLSGHTHGMQFGIEILNLIKWSPVQWRYQYWGGIYENNNRYINVNRGFGFLGFPGRVGMPPEITVIELRKK